MRINNNLYKIEFNNGLFIETSNFVAIYREGKNKDAVLRYKTSSKDDYFDLNNAAVVSGKRGDNFPYVFNQTENGVELIVRNSTNPVSVNDTRITDGKITITETSDVYIGNRFNVTVHV